MKTCCICGRQAYWKIYDLVNDKTSYVCLVDIGMALPQSDLIELTRVAQVEDTETIVVPVK